MTFQPYFDSGFPHGFDQWISAAGPSWATLALSLAAPAHNRKHIGIAGTVVALDRSTGSEVWWSDLDGDFVYGALQDGDLYATANGELFCLDPATGDIRWQNPLKGLGRGYITIAASGSQQAIVMRDKKRRDDEAAAASSGT